jgi:hypothetical protein
MRDRGSVRVDTDMVRLLVANAESERDWTRLLRSLVGCSILGDARHTSKELARARGADQRLKRGLVVPGWAVDHWWVSLTN